MEPLKRGAPRIQKISRTAPATVVGLSWHPAVVALAVGYIRHTLLLSTVRMGGGITNAPRCFLDHWYFSEIPQVGPVRRIWDT